MAIFIIVKILLRMYLNIHFPPTSQQPQNICITSSTLDRYCTNVLQMFCVYWVVTVSDMKALQEFSLDISKSANKKYSKINNSFKSRTTTYVAFFQHGYYQPFGLMIFRSTWLALDVAFFQHGYYQPFGLMIFRSTWLACSWHSKR